MANYFFPPFIQISDANGLPLEGGTLTFSTSGTSTATDTYSDSGLTTPNANPLTLNAQGRPDTDIFLDPTITYRVVIKNADATVFDTFDPVMDPGNTSVASIRIHGEDPNGDVAGDAGTLGGVGADMIFDTANQLLWVCSTTGSATTAVWTQIGSILSGAVIASSTLTPTSLAAATYNDYAPTDLTSAFQIRQASTGAITINGLTTGTDGRLIVWTNISAFAHTFADEAAGSAAANRFALDAALILPPDMSAMFVYDGPSARWRLQGAVYATTTDVLTGTNTTRAMTPDSAAAFWEQGSNVASAATITLGEGGYIIVTGVTTITDVDMAVTKAGRGIWVEFSGILTLTHNATTLILPGKRNIKTAAGDTALFISEGGDNVRCVVFQRAEPFIEYNMGTFAVSTDYTQAHGLGVMPRDFRVWLECTTIDLNWAVGDRVSGDSFQFTGGYAFATGMNATNLYYSTESSAPFVINKTTNDNSVAITAARWDVIFVVNRSP